MAFLRTTAVIRPDGDTLCTSPLPASPGYRIHILQAAPQKRVYIRAGAMTAERAQPAEPYPAPQPTAGPGSAVAGRASGWAGRNVAPGSVGRQGVAAAAAATLERNVEVALAREEGRRRMLGDSDGRCTNAGSGCSRSLPGVSTRCFLSSSPVLKP